MLHPPSESPRLVTGKLYLCAYLKEEDSDLFVQKLRRSRPTAVKIVGDVALMILL
jgi:hypothetical protein